MAGDHASLPIAYRLYLPQEWADDHQARAQAGVPDDVVFKTKPQIALDQLRAAKAAGITVPIVLADAGYGNDTAFREGITQLGLGYIVGIQSTTSLWPPGKKPLAKKVSSGRGRPTSAIRRDGENQPISAKQLALTLPYEAWRRVTWREGSNTMLSSRFAAVRVRPVHRDYEGSKPRDEEWCLIEWPADEPEPTKYWLSTLPAKISRRALVNTNTAKQRWRIERDYQDLKQELGLGQYERRGWRGFHITRHSVLLLMDSCSANKQLFPPQDNATPFSSKNPPYPEIIDPVDPPIRPERHLPNSITSVRTAIARAIARTLPRCPCCQQVIRRKNL